MGDSRRVWWDPWEAVPWHQPKAGAIHSRRNTVSNTVYHHTIVGIPSTDTVKRLNIVVKKDRELVLIKVWRHTPQSDSVGRKTYRATKPNEQCL